MPRLLAFVEAATVTGPAKNLLDFCRAITCSGLPVEMHIATFSRRGGGNEFTDAVRSANVPLTVIQERRSFDLGVTAAIGELIRTLKPDIVQTHAVKSHFLLSISRIPIACRWVAFHHGYTTTDFKMRLYNQLDRWSLRKPVRLVTVSRAFEKQLIDIGVDPSRIFVLQNAISPEWAERVRRVDRTAFRRQLSLNVEDKVVLAVGRMSVEKAHCDLIEAIRILRRDRPMTRLILVGEGPERANLEAVAGAWTIFAGQTGDVAPYYAIADAMALPSLTEGSPNVLLEAMACGLPAVATAVGGIPEMVTDGETALLVPARDPGKMAGALNQILFDRELAERLASSSLDLISRKHSVGARAQALVEIYAGLPGIPV